MTKKSLLTVIPVACAALTSQAGTMGDMPPVHSPFEGVYIGAEGGFLNASSDTTSTTSNQIGYGTPQFGYIYSGQFAVGSNQRIKNNNFFGNGSFSLGIGKLFYEQWYVGAEAAVNIGPKQTHRTENTSFYGAVPYYNSIYIVGFDNANNTAIDTKLNYAEFDLDAKIGNVWHNDTLFYGRVGAAFNHLSIKQFLNSQTFITDAVTDPNLNYEYGNVLSSKSENIVGIRAGIGMEHALLDYLSVRLDYTYTWYPSLFTNGSGSIINDRYYAFSNTLNGLATSMHSKLNTQNILLGVNLYLDNLFN